MAKKTRRRVIAVSALLLMPLIGVGVYWAMQSAPKPGVTLDNFRRLRVWMTVEQAETILGSAAESVSPDCLTGSDQFLFVWNGSDGIQCRLHAGQSNDKSISYIFEGACYEHDKLKVRLASGPESAPQRVYRWVKDWTGW
jgi:hypothetical protein